VLDLPPVLVRHRLFSKRALRVQHDREAFINRNLSTAADHQATMGSWVGRTKVVDGAGQMVDWTYVDGGDVLPPPAEAKAMRPTD